MNIAKIGMNYSFTGNKKTESPISQKLNAKYSISEETENKINKIQVQYSKLKRSLIEREKMGFVKNFTEEMEFLKEQESILIRAFRNRGY